MSTQFDTGQRFGAYQLGKLLGRGGMGVVYQAQHVHLGRTVALKLLAPELSSSEDFRARFLREARLAAELEHPGVVAVYDAGDVDGVLYLAMRFVRGTDLAALLVQRGPLGATETSAILEQVGSALDAAHAAGLVHRDVKPANVMIEGQRCYLADFGLTKRASSDSVQLTAAGQFLGTVDYISPEQIEGREVSGRADVYALGCVLFECLTGSRPYPRDSQIAVIYAQLREPPPRPSELRPDLPAAIDPVIAKAMAKKAADRYQTCGEMVIDMRAALEAPAADTVPVEAPPPQPPPTSPTSAIPLPPPEQPAPAPTPVPSAAQLPTSPLPPSVVAQAPPAQPPSRETGRRRSPVPFIAAALALVAVAVAAVVLLSGGSDKKAAATSQQPQATSATPQQPKTGPRVVGDALPAGADPVGIVIRDDSLFVANESADTVTQIKPETGETFTLHVGDGPFDMASNNTAVWSANSLDGTVTKIPLSSGKPEPAFPVGTDPFYLTAENDFVYVSNSGDNSVSVLDAKTGKRVVPDDIPVGEAPRGITTSDDGHVWVANSGSGSVTEIVDNKVARTIPTGKGASNVAFGDEAIFVSNTDAGTVSRVDIHSSDVTTETVGSEPAEIAFGDDVAWVAVSGADKVVRLDGHSGKLVGEPIPVPGRPTGVTAPDGSVWVTATDRGTVSLIEPR
jgi:YVTN family beta-propeller protein